MRVVRATVPFYLIALIEREREAAVLRRWLRVAAAFLEVCSGVVEADR